VIDWRKLMSKISVCIVMLHVLEIMNLSHKHSKYRKISNGTKLTFHVLRCRSSIINPHTPKRNEEHHKNRNLVAQCHSIWNEKWNEYNLTLRRASDIKPVASAWTLYDHNVIIPRYNILLHFKLLLCTLHIISWHLSNVYTLIHTYVRTYYTEYVLNL
jgi:hypothetical protein